MRAAHEPTIGIICAKSADLDAVAKIFDQAFEVTEVEGIVYHHGRIQALDVVAVQESEDQHAAFYALKLREHHPSLVSKGSCCFLLGGAAHGWAPREDVQPGEVIVASGRLTWLSKKAGHGDVGISALHVERTSNDLYARVMNFLENPTHVDRILAGEVYDTQSGLEVEHNYKNAGSGISILNRGRPSVFTQENHTLDHRGSGRYSKPRIRNGLIVASMTPAEEEQILDSTDENTVLIADKEASAVLAEMKNVVVIRSIGVDNQRKGQPISSIHDAPAAATCAKLMISSFAQTPQSSCSSEEGSHSLVGNGLPANSATSMFGIEKDCNHRLAGDVKASERKDKNSDRVSSISKPDYLDPTASNQNSTGSQTDQSTMISGVTFDRSIRSEFSRLDTTRSEVYSSVEDSNEEEFNVEDVNQGVATAPGRDSYDNYDPATSDLTSEQTEYSDRRVGLTRNSQQYSTEPEPVFDALYRFRSLDTSTTSQTECPDDWSKPFHARARQLKVTLMDAGDKGNKVEEMWDTAQVMISAFQNSRIDLAQWKLIIDGAISGQPRYRELWLPLTRVRVSKSEPSVTIRFSDCNNMLNLGTTNAIQNYTAVYNPEQPNVVIRFVFETIDDAVRFEDCLLHRTPIMFADTDMRRQELPDSSLLMIPTLRARGEELIGVLTEAENQDPGGKYWYRDVKLFSFSPKLGFELSLGKTESSIEFQYVHQFMYTPVDVGNCAYWPPQEVKDNVEGHPKSTYFGGGSTPNSTIPLRTTNDTILGLMNLTVGFLTQWQIQEYFLVDFNLHFPKILKAVRRNSKPRAGQLTIWTKNCSTRLLLRSENRDKDTPIDWTSCTIDPGSASPLPQLKQAVEHTITVENTEFRTGVYLSSDDFQPDAPEQERADAATSLQIQFGSGVDLDRFLRQVDGIYGDLYRNRRDSD